jgi:hypothetical protein
MKFHSKKKREESDVRQGTTDRGSANITNSVFGEVQFLQRLVFAANQTQTRLNNDQLSIKKFGGVAWERMFIQKIKKRTYARPAPIPETPA